MILNKKNYILGTGGHSRPVIENLKMNGLKNINLIDLKFSKKKNNNILGIKVVCGFNNIVKSDLSKSKNFYLAIGNNILRKKYFNYLRKLVRTPNLISKNSFLSSYADIGEGNFLNHFSFIGQNTLIGNNNIFNTRSLIEHDVVIGDHCHICPGVKIAGNVKIGSNVFLGLGTVVIDNVNICSNVKIGAGSIIYKDILKPGTYIDKRTTKFKK